MNIAVVFAGGIGKRMNSKSVPKQFLKLHGKDIIIHTLEHFEFHKDIDGIVVACVEDWIPYLEKLLKKFDIEKVRDIVPGGKTGQESIYNGLVTAKERYGEDSVVLIHDGVRPLIEEKTISDCIISVKENGSGITVAPAIETIIRVEDDKTIRDVIERSECLMARAPQCFRLCDILECHHKAIAEEKHDFIDSAQLMKYYGHGLSIVNGPVENIKITTPMDYYTFKALYEARESSQLFGGLGE